MTDQVIAKLLAWCDRHLCYGPWDFKEVAHINSFAFSPATDDQIKETEDILGFSLPPFLRSLYQEVANGGFGPGAGLAGAVGGYGSIDTTTITGYQALSDERVVKNHTRGNVQRFVSLAQVSDSWRMIKGQNVLLLDYELWMREMLFLFDMGDQIEVCATPDGQIFLYGPSAWDGLFAFTAKHKTLQQWLLEQLAVPA